MGLGYLSHYILVFPTLLHPNLYSKFSAKNQVIKFMEITYKLKRNPPSLYCNPLIQVAALDLASGVET